MWRRTPDADDRPPDATGGCRRDAAWMLKNAEAMTLPRGGGATCKLDASDPKERTYFDGYAAMRRGGGEACGDMRRRRGVAAPLSPHPLSAFSDSDSGESHESKNI